MSYFLMTNDVECFSFEHNQYELSVAKRVLKQGLPRLLDLYDKYNINATFFYTGRIVEIEPEIIDIVKERGNHEIGCHGYSHELEHAFDIMSLKQQIEHLRKAKNIIEKTANKKITSFRAPAVRINADTMKALEITGFNVDSSVSSQRFDGPLSYSSKAKIKWLYAPRMPYKPSRENPFMRGNSEILEIPISAILFAYIGTTMRISLPIMKIIQKILIKESKKTGKPLVFLIHPNEVMDLNNNDIIKNRRGKTLIQNVFADSIRQKLKLKCLGEQSLKRLESLIIDHKNENTKFITCMEYKVQIGE